MTPLFKVPATLPEAAALIKAVNDYYLDNAESIVVEVIPDQGTEEAPHEVDLIVQGSGEFMDIVTGEKTTGIIRSQAVAHVFFYGGDDIFAYEDDEAENDLPEPLVEPAVALARVALKAAGF